MALTAKDVLTKRFASPIIGRRGYRPGEVDAFLRRVAATLRDRDDLTAKDVHAVAFSRPKRNELGYSEDEVDAYLDVIEQELTRRTLES
jgi:DivIVA domain-containing protein